MTQSLLQEELDQGFCLKLEDSAEDAKKRWPVGLALGKLGW